MKNVLCIVYFFPPIGGSGVQRSLKFIKYLPLYGATPIVSTVKEGHNFAYDTEMIKEVPSSVKIYRSNSGEKLWLRKQIESGNKFIIKAKRLIGSINKYKDKKEEYQDTESLKDQVKYTIKDKVFRYLEYNHYVPDSKIRWYKHAVKDIKKRIITNENIDIIFSTSYPYTDHLIALEIKKTINKPWVADFRDPWVDNKFIYDRYDEKRKVKERALEREVVTYADKIINVTDYITQQYIERYPEFKDKFITITNGFDINDKVSIDLEKDKFIINYSGIVTDGQDPNIIISAIKMIIKENSNFNNDFIINFTGSIHEKYMYLFEDEELKNKIKVNSYIPHSEVLKEMKKASINLIILPNIEESKGIYTGKIFDYILSERPILGVMPSGGVASNLINSTGIGKSIGFDDINEAKEFIESIYDLWKKGDNLNTNSSEICKEFERKNLTKQLADIFNSF